MLGLFALQLLTPVLLTCSLRATAAVAIENKAISEYEFDMAAAYGVDRRTEISHDNLQRIIKGAQQGNKGATKWSANIAFLVIINYYYSDNIYFLGLLKLYGIALTKHAEAACDHFKQAADLGLADAQTAYGIMLVQGSGQPSTVVDSDHTEYICCDILTVIIYVGVQQDFVAAEKYFRMAVSQDNTNGMWLLAKWECWSLQCRLYADCLIEIIVCVRLLLDGFTGVKGAKLTEAVHLLQKAADRRSAQAEHFLALLYEYGRGVPQDFQKALLYYKRAAEQHNIESIYNLALMYMFSRGVQQDFKRALPLLQKAAKNSHAPSMYYLGVLKMNGHGTSIDYEEAMGWFERAAALDDFRISGVAAESYKEVRRFMDEANEENFRVLDEYMARNAADLEPRRDF